LLRIIANKDGCASQQIFNIGNPQSDVSVAALADAIVEGFRAIPEYAHLADTAKIETIAAETYYGQYYQDIQVRVPAIHHAAEKLGWKPSTDFNTAIRKTLQYHVRRGDFMPDASADHS
jgi:nucleoside-diphosphate-sugar epimerase